MARPGAPVGLPGPLDGFVRPAPGTEPIEVGGLVEVVGEPTAEVPINVGRSRIFALKKPVARIMIANPAIANVRFLDPDCAQPPTARRVRAFVRSDRADDLG